MFHSNSVLVLYQLQDIQQMFHTPPVFSNATLDDTIHPLESQMSWYKKIGVMGFLALDSEKCSDMFSCCVRAYDTSLMHRKTKTVTTAVTGQLMDTPTRGLPTRGLDISRTGQVVDWTTRGCYQ